MRFSLRGFCQGFVAIVAGRVIAAVVNVLLVPLFLLHWTPARYGEWLALTSFASYLATLDLGMNMAAVNRMTQAYARGDVYDYTETQRAALFFYTSVASVGTIVLAAFVTLIPINTVLGLEETTASEASVTGLVLGLLVLWAMPASLAASVFRTTGNLSKSQWLGNAQQVFAAILAVVALQLGAGVALIAGTQLAALIITTGCVVYSVRRGSPALLPRFGRPRRAILLTLMKTAISFVLVVAATTVSVQGSVTLLSVSLGGTAVAVFVATRTMVNLVRQVVGSIMNAIWPDITRLETLGEFQTLRTLHTILIIGSSTLSIAFAAALWFEGADVLRIWTLGRLSADPVLIRLMLVMLVLQSPWLASLVFTVATNRHARLSIRWFVGSCLGIAAAVILVPRFGVAAIPLGLILGEALTCYHSSIQETCEFLGQAYPPLARRMWFGLTGIMVVTLSAGWVAHAVVPGPMVMRWIVVGTVTSAIAAATAWIGWLNAEERTTLLRRVRPLAATALAWV